MNNSQNNNEDILPNNIDMNGQLNNQVNINNDQLSKQFTVNNNFNTNNPAMNAETQYNTEPQNTFDNHKKNKIIFIFVGLLIGLALILFLIKLFTKKGLSILPNANIDIKKYISLVNDEDDDGKVSVGDKYTYQVNDTDTFIFYVLSIEDEIINLIMDRNICENGIPTNEKGNDNCPCAWYEDEDGDFTNVNNTKGPISALSYLYKATNDWNNVPNMNLEYDDILDQQSIKNSFLDSTEFGYIGVSIKNGAGTIIGKKGEKTQIKLENNKPMKARLPKYSEIKNIEINEPDRILPAWLVENLEYHDVSNSGFAIDKYKINKNSTKNSNVYGYWLLSSNCAILEYGRNVESLGLSRYQPIDTKIGSGYGIRPVISIPKDSI